MEIEALLVEWLNNNPEVTPEAFMDVPRTRPKQFITVERVGGGEGPVTGRPLLAVQRWAQHRFEASQGAIDLSKVLPQFVEHPGIARVQVDSVYNMPDPDSGQARYQLTVEVVTHDG